MKKVKSNEESIMNIFVHDIHKEKAKLNRKFSKRATKLLNNKAITNGKFQSMRILVRSEL